MFSIVIPLYNKAQYIHNAIQCILNQSFQHFEIIIVDDGSTDNSIQVVKTFCDSRISIIHQANSGVSIARNNGVKHATYEHIAFLDADDWWDKYFLEEMYHLITLYPNAAIYGSNYFIVKNSLNHPTQIGLPSNFKIGYIDYIKTYSNTFWVPFNCSFVVVNKKAFENIGGFKHNLKFGEDFDVWLQIALKYSVAYINKPLAYSNQDSDPLNRALGSKKKWKKEEHMIFNLEYLKQEESLNTDLKYLLDGLRIRNLTDFYLNGLYKKEISQTLHNINFYQHPYIYTFIYKYPLPIVYLYFKFKEFGSKIKQRLLVYNLK